MTTGIIIGRFQVPELTPGHVSLFVKAYEMFDQVGVLLGVPVQPSPDNPLPVEARAQMIGPWQPLFIGKVKDHPGNNKAWSAAVDDQVSFQGEWHELGTVVLLGGRKSFVSAYEGRYPTAELPLWFGKSGTEVRSDITNGDVIDSVMFRKGIIWQVTNGSR